MSLIKRFTPSPAMVIGCLALLLTLGGTGYAASKALPRNSVTSIQVKDHSLLSRDFKAGQLPRGPAGPAGAAGPAGPQGPAGPAGTGGTVAIKWALVRARRRHRCTVRRHHPRRQAERRHVHPQLRQRGHREGDPRFRRLCGRRRPTSAARRPQARAVAAPKDERARCPNTHEQRVRADAQQTPALRRTIRSTSRSSAKNAPCGRGSSRAAAATSATMAA